MLCWRPSQIKPHQVSYEIVEQWVVLKVIVAEDISFFTIWTDFNVSPEASNRHTYCRRFYDFVLSMSSNTYLRGFQNGGKLKSALKSACFYGVAIGRRSNS